MKTKNVERYLALENHLEAVRQRLDDDYAVLLLHATTYRDGDELGNWLRTWDALNLCLDALAPEQRQRIADLVAEMHGMPAEEST